MGRFVVECFRLNHIHDGSMEQKKQKLSIEEKIKLQRDKLKKLEEQAREKKKRDSDQMKRALYDLLQDSGLGDLTIEDWRLLIPTIKTSIASNGSATSAHESDQSAA